MTQEKDKTVQTKFFDQLKENLHPSLNLANEVAEVIGVSPDSAYRRIRGETPLTVNELSMLIAHFKIGFDMFANQAGSVTFNFNQMYGLEGFKVYLNDILSELETLAKLNKSEIYYAAVDIPIFHHFRFPELAAFKMFYWLKGVLNEPSLEGVTFNTSIIPNELKTLGMNIYNAYCKVPGIEIWTQATINSTLMQVEYYWEAGFIENKELALILVTQVEEMIKVIQRQAELSSKTLESNDSKPENFKLYYSDIEIGNNCIITSKEETKAVYLSFHTFNKLSTHNAKFCDDTIRWINNLIKRSTLISGVSEKQRNIFFKQAFDKIEQLKEKIK